MAEGKKYDTGKLRFDLLPPGPLSLVAQVYTIGARKYDDRNWENGILYSRLFAALQRHAWAYWTGERTDPRDGQHHLASVCWAALALMEYENTHPELDDRPYAKSPNGAGATAALKALQGGGEQRPLIVPIPPEFQGGLCQQDGGSRDSSPE